MHSVRWNRLCHDVLFYHCIILLILSFKYHSAPNIITNSNAPSTITCIHTLLHFNLPPQRHHLPSGPAVACNMYLQSCRKSHSVCLWMSACVHIYSPSVSLLHSSPVNQRRHTVISKPQSIPSLPLFSFLFWSFTWYFKSMFHKLYLK